MQIALKNGNLRKLRSQERQAVSKSKIGQWRSILDLMAGIQLFDDDGHGEFRRSTTVMRPSVFIGSSSEGKKFAVAVQAALQSIAEVTAWNQGVFAPGQTFIESLIAAPAHFDFAVLLLTPDDVVQSRSTELSSPRDNIIFELCPQQHNELGKVLEPKPRFFSTVFVN